GNRDAFFLRIDDEDGIGEAVHLFNAAKEAFEFVELFLELRDFFFWKAVEIALSLHVLEFAQARDALLNRREVGERAAEPALIDKKRPGAFSFFADHFLRLLLGTDEENDFLLARHLLDDF